jgi:hypothetical protein
MVETKVVSTIPITANLITFDLFIGEICSSPHYL